MNLENSSRPLSSYTPNGSQTLSKMACRFPAIYPKTIVRGDKGHVYDERGLSYIDFISGLGCVSVGYCDTAINEAIERQLRQGITFSLPHKLEYLAAKKLTDLIPWTEQWKFGKNGTDGTVMAVRAARAYTGRTKILTVGYNGCADQFEIKGVRNAGIPKLLDFTIKKLEFNQLPEFIYELCSHEYACVLLEPMVYEYPRMDFLESLRQICTETGTLLIFDEVVMGGRTHAFCGSSNFNVVPDFIVLGKAIANGLPLCAVGGTRQFMSVFERDDFFASNTFGGETLSLAAFMETTERLKVSIPKMIWNGSRIKEAFNKLDWDGKAECIGYPTRLFFKFENLTTKAIFMQEMCKRNVLLGQGNFVMASHTDDDITHTINAIFDSWQAIKNGVTLEGALPVDAIRKG